MKSTTKILIGILLSGVVAMIVGAILCCTIEWTEDQELFDGKPVSISVAPFHAVKVCVETGKPLTEKELIVQGDLSIVPAVGGENQLSYPVELAHYLSVATKNDTLCLTFKLSEENLSDELRKKKSVYFKFSKMTLQADSSLTAVQSDVERLSLNLLKLKADSISLSGSYLVVDSCHFQTLSVMKAESLKLKHSRIHNTYLDLDKVLHQHVSDCQLENVYLTGSETHGNSFEKGECQQMYWIPKKAGAALRVTLHEAASVSALK